MGRSVRRDVPRSDAPLDPWVRIMADYGSDGMWSRSGTMFCRHHLPVSEELLRRHEAWCDLHERYDADADREGRGDDFDLPGFAAEGLLIAQAIKKELPGWTVIYFDAFLSERYQDISQRSHYEFEVLADAA